MAFDAEHTALYGAVEIDTRRFMSVEMEEAEQEQEEDLLVRPARVEADEVMARKRTRDTFIPVVCSIFGVIIFMRLGIVVGTLGLLHAWLVIVVAFVITFLTVGSLSALASSSDVTDEGGLFGAMQHTLDARMGRVMCGMFFLAFGIATAYYLLGFSEITLFYLGIEPNAYPLPWDKEASWITVLFASGVLFVLTFTFIIGIRTTRRTLRFIFVVMMLAIVCNVLFLLLPNNVTHTGVSTSNLTSNLSNGDPAKLVNTFNSFFPAYCGVMAGANLADFLINPSNAPQHTNPRAHQEPMQLILGVHRALLFCLFVYVMLSLVLAVSVSHDFLLEQRFVVQLVVDSILGVPVIYLGIGFTTLSSALSNIMAAAGVARMLLENKVWSNNTSRRNGLGSNGDRSTTTFPAIFWSWVLSQAVILCGSLDATIPLVSATFLLVFAVVNFTCFFQEISSTSFHPSFIMYSKWTAFLGFCLSLGALFLALSAAFASAVVVASVCVLVYFQVTSPEAEDELRRHGERNSSTYFERSSSVHFDRRSSLAAESPSKLLQYSASMRLRRARSTSVDDRASSIQLAALYVRDALHGRFLGEAYVVEGYHRLELKRWYHSLQVVRVGNMFVLLALGFFEIPSWCYFDESCGDRSKVLTWNLPMLSRPESTMVEIVNLSILAGEMVLKYQYLGQRLFFINKWRIVQMICLLANVVAILLVAFVSDDDGIGSSATDSKPVVISPLIRPLLLLTMSERLRSGFASLARMLPRVFDGLLTIVVIIVIYAISGMVIFEGTVEGEQYFASFGEACLNLLILLTTANFPDVMMPAYQDFRFYSIFFISFLAIGLLLVMNLVFASIYQNYRAEVEQRAIQFSERRQDALEFAFDLLPGEYVGHTQPEPNTNEVPFDEKIISAQTYEDMMSELLRPVFSLFKVRKKTKDKLKKSARQGRSSGRNVDEITFPAFVTRLKAFAERRKTKSRLKKRRPIPPSRNAVVNRITETVRSEQFDFGVDVLILANLLTILFEIQAKIDNEEGVYLEWEKFMPLFSCAYVVEMLLKMYAYGFARYFDRTKNIYDCVVTLVILTGQISIQAHPTAATDWSWVRILLLLRFLRCLRLLVAFHALSAMFDILLRLLPAFATLFGMLGIVLVEYGAIGVNLFGGKISQDDPRLLNTTYGSANYYSNNFNDFPSALTTLFELLMVNNWFVIMGGFEAVTSKWCRVFFISFYVIAVVIVLNLVVAFVVEAYFEQAATTESIKPANEPSTMRQSTSFTSLSAPASSQAIFQEPILTHASTGDSTDQNTPRRRSGASEVVKFEEFL